MKTNKILSKVLVLLYTLYVFSTVLPLIGAFSSVFLVLILLINNFYFIKCLLLRKSTRNNLVIIIGLLYIINVLGYIFTGNLADSASFGMFKNINLTLSSFFSFYYFGIKKINLDTLFKLFLIISIPLTILLFYKTEQDILLERIRDNSDVVNNTGYIFLFLTPYLFLFKNKLIINGLSLLLLTFIIQSSKRGAIIIFLIVFIYSLYLQFKDINKKNIRTKIMQYGFLSSLFTVFLVYLYNIINNNIFLLERLGNLESGNVSGRDSIFSSIIDSWLSAQHIWQLLFGFGFASSLRLTDTNNFAHNDWLELLSNFGLLGVLLYLLFYINLFKIIINYKNSILSISIIIMFSSTLFSMYYTSINGFILTQIAGYFVGKYISDKKTKIKYLKKQ